MARKDELSGKLDSSQSGERWRRLIGPKDETELLEEDEVLEDLDELKRKTYLLTPRIIRRVERMAEKNDIGINELARYLLTWALDQHESGEAELPVTTKTIEKRGLDF